MSKLNYSQAGLHTSWIAVAGPDPADVYAHEYSPLVYGLGLERPGTLF